MRPFDALVGKARIKYHDSLCPRSDYLNHRPMDEYSQGPYHSTEPIPQGITVAMSSVFRAGVILRPMSPSISCAKALQRSRSWPTRTLSTQKRPGRLQNKVAVITGASSSIGRAIAFAYSAEGAHIVNADLRETTKYQSHSEETRGTTHDRITEAGGQAIFVRTDITEPASVEGAVRQAVERFGRVDIMGELLGWCGEAVASV